MAPKKKVTAEERKLQKRIAERLRYAKLKSDPEKAMELKIKNQEKKRKRKEEGKQKPISAMTEREKRAQRKKWRECSRNYRQRKKDEIQDLEKEHNVEPTANGNSSDVAGPLTTPARSVAYQISSGQKRKNENRRQLRTENKRLKDENTHLKQKIDSIRNRYEINRQKSHKNSSTEFKSPNTKVKNILKLNDPKVVKKRLLFGETLVQQLKDNWKTTKSISAKRSFSKAIIEDAKWLKMYGLLGRCNFIPTKCLRNDIRSRQSNSCKDRRARKLTNLVRSEVQMFLE